MKKDMVRLLRADEIECRVSSVSEKGVSLLLYKDARVDQKILDETFGMFGWKRSHQCIDGNLYCTVEVFDQENGCWVAKQDVGTTGHTEKEKSQASDSFKRACFNWGIGRELYTAPFIWVPARDAEIKPKDRKFCCNDHFSVAAIGYNNDREIISLQILNETKKGKTVYELHDKTGQAAHGISGSVKEKAPEEKREAGISDQQIHILEAELQRTGIGMDAVKDRYGFDRPQDMSEEMYGRAMKALAKTKTLNHVVA